MGALTYDGWKLRSDRDDDWWNETEPRHGFCPRCAAPLEEGFGLAAGGYGPYIYCPQCEQIVEPEGNLT